MVVEEERRGEGGREGRERGGRRGESVGWDGRGGGGGRRAKGGRGEGGGGGWGRHFGVEGRGREEERGGRERVGWCEGRVGWWGVVTIVHGPVAMRVTAGHSLLNIARTFAMFALFTILSLQHLPINTPHVLHMSSFFTAQLGINTRRPNREPQLRPFSAKRLNDVSTRSSE